LEIVIDLYLLTTEATTPPTAPRNEGVLATCQASHDYTAEHDDELTLKTGDIIEVLKKQEDDWWLGVNKEGQKGLFPSTFVTEIPSPVLSEERSDSSDFSRSTDDLPEPILGTFRTYKDHVIVVIRRTLYWRS
jgi:hypothetical protein